MDVLAWKDGSPEERPARARRPWRQGGPVREAVTITLDMLVIGLAALAGCALTGRDDAVPLCALGIAIYISSKHFSHLRREIQALRDEAAARQPPEPALWSDAGEEPVSDSGERSPRREPALSLLR
jgi:hypothetical protein